MFALILLLLHALHVEAITIGVIYHESLNLTHPARYLETWMSLTLESLQFQIKNLQVRYIPYSTNPAEKTRLANQNLTEASNLDGAIIALQCISSERMAEHLVKTRNVTSESFLLILDFVACLSPKQEFEDSRFKLYRVHPAKQLEYTLQVISDWVNNLMSSNYRRKVKIFKSGITDHLGEAETCSNVRGAANVYPTHFSQPPPLVLKEELSGQQLRLTTLEDAPFVIPSSAVGTSKTKLGGYCFEIINAMMDKYNYSYSVTYPADKSYGTESSNGSFSGMIGMIYNGMADVGASTFTITHLRTRVVDFTYPFYEEPTALLIPPPTEMSQLFACTRPFQWQVWVLLILVVLLLPAALMGLYTFKLKTPPSNPTGRGMNKPSLSGLYFFVYGVLTTQSGQKVPSIGSAPRFLAAVWCLCAVVFIYLYMGTLISFLSVPKLKPVVNSLEEVPASDLECGARRGTALDSLFSEATEGIFHILGQRMLKNPQLLVQTDQEGFDRVVSEKAYSYISGKSFLSLTMHQDYSKTGQCRVSLAKEEFWKTWQAFPLPKNSVLLAAFNKEILRAIETGLTDYWQRKYWPPENRCKHLTQGTKARTLNILDLQSAFLVLGTGLLLALITYAFEWIHCCFFNSRM